MTSSIYSGITRNSRNPLKRYSHSKRFKLALSALNLQIKEASTLLDYGASDCYFSELALSVNSDLRITSYEPYDHFPSFLNSSIVYTRKIPASTFDFITCFEVFEHLSNKAILRVLSDIRKLSHSETKILVSVPLETGLSSFAKNIARLLTREHHPGTSFSTIYNSILGRHNLIHRNFNNDYCASHLGFSWKELRSLLEENFSIQQQFFSPIPFTNRYLNSQVFFVLGLR